MQTIEGDFSTPRGSIAIVAARFNEMIVEQLIQGARDTLSRHGVKPEAIDLIRVPGGYELPLACQSAAQSGRYQGIIALGVVIKGATPHFDYVAGTAANGVAQASLKTNIPMTFGVLTTDTIEQAIERAGTKAGNKGADAAFSLIEMMNLVERLNG